LEQQVVLNKLQDIISFYLEDPLEVTMDTHILKDLTVNSFDYSSIIADIEEIFNITIDDLTIYYIKDLVQIIMDRKEI